MAVPLTVNGVVYQYPELTDEGWGPDATKWAVAINQGTLQKTGGLFTLTSDVDFGAAFGIKALYYKTRSSSIATSGNFRLANTDTIAYRNAGNTADILFGAGSSDAVPSWGGVDLVNLTATQTLTNKTIVGAIFTGGTFNSPTINTPTVNGGTFANPSISSPSISNPTFSGISLFPDGTVGAPAVAFSSEHSTGLYRVGSNQFGFAVGGTNLLTLTNGLHPRSIIGIGQFSVPDGTVALPSYTFESEQSTGFYKSATNQISVAIGGAQVLLIGNNILQALGSLRFAAVDGSASGPSITFASSFDTMGFFRKAANSLGFSTSSTEVGSISAAGLWTIGASGGTQTHVVNGNLSVTGTIISSGSAVELEDGTVSAPSLSFVNEPNTGIFRPSGGTIGFTVLGGEKLQINPTSIQAIVQFAAPTSPSPGYAFIGDLTTGVALGGGNALHLVQGGVVQLRLNGSSISTTTSVFNAIAGSVGTPTYSFGSDQTTGMFLDATAELGFAAGGILSALLTSGYSEFYFPIRHEDGSAGAPTITFRNETTTGFFRDASGSIDLTSGGTTNRLHISNSIANATMAVLLNSNGGGTGDQYISFAEASSDTQAWTLGRDDSNAGGFTISQKFNQLGTNNVLFINTAGAYEIGSPAYLGNDFHFVFGSLLGNTQSAATNWNIGNGNQLDLTINLYRPSSGTMKAVATQTGYVWSTFSRPTAPTDVIFEIDSNYQDAQTQGVNVVQTNNLQVFRILANGTVSVRNMAVTNGQLSLTDGTQSAPALNFINETNTGLYRVSGGALGITTNGTLRLQINPTSIQAQVPFAAQDGTAGSPSHTFINDLTTGMYRVSSNVLGFSAGGTELLELLNGINPRSRITIGQFSVPNGTAALPAYTFESQQDSGFYRISGNSIGLSVAGAVAFSWTNLLATSFNPLKITGGQNLLLNNSGNTNSIGLNGNAATSSYNISLPASAPGTNTFLKFDGSNYVWSGAGAGTGDINNGGNSFGTPISIGTNDNFGLSFKTNGTTAISIDTSWKLTLGATGSSQQHVINGGSIFYSNPTGDGQTVDMLQTAALADNTSNILVAQWDPTLNGALLIDYSVKRNGNFEVGTMTIVNDGTSPQIIIGSSANIGSTGVTFSVDISTNLRLLATTTSTGFTGTMKFNVRRWQI